MPLSGILDILGLSVKNISSLVSKIGVARLSAMLGVTMFLLGFFAFLILRVSEPQLAPLYTQLSFEDSSAIVSELQASGIVHKIRGEGSVILVPRDDITRVRMQLAQSNLPTGGSMGYEIFDNSSSLGTTSFVQNINHLRALEGELVRTISSLSRVQNARVHLAIPKERLFNREEKTPSASIVLKVRGVLSGGEIRAIQHLVASAVEGLNPTRVSIVDDKGTLLASGDDSTAIGATGHMHDQIVAFETRMQKAVEALISNVVGSGRARVQVNAELDFNRLTRTQEAFDPNGQVVRSTQTRELSDSSSETVNNQGVSVAAELPNAGADGAQTGSSNNSSTTEETTNFEIGKTTTVHVTEPGSIKRLSVAVVVDGTYSPGENGISAYQPRDQAELDQIAAIVRSAVGFDANRGDVVEVVNLQFAEGPDVIEFSDSGSIFDFTRDDLFYFAEMAVTLLISALLIFFVIRPLLSKALVQEEEPAQGTQMVVSDNGDLVPVALDENGQITSEAISTALANPTDEKMNLAKALGEQQMGNLKEVGDLVLANPSQATMVVRDWVNEGARA